MCWGDGDYGQLGAGTEEGSITSVSVENLTSTTTHLAMGAYQGCARLADATAACWGSNRFGQLGDGTRERRSTAVSVKGLGGPVRDVAAGASFSCALLVNGRVQCWGSNVFGELGSGGAKPDPAAQFPLFPKETVSPRAKI